MVHRMTPAQYQAWVRQQQAKQRQAQQQYNQKVKRHNQEVERQIRAQNQAIENYNRAARQYNRELAREISQYNLAVQRHNARVRSDRQSLQRQLAELKSRSVVAHYTSVRISTYELYDQFERMGRSSDRSDARGQLVDLSEQESRNSLTVMNALLSDDDEEEIQVETWEEDTGILGCLQALSSDLCSRWKGAVFSLNPANPDAARHFCTSVREIFTEILEITARDDVVEAADPICERTQQGKPTRKSKIIYLLRSKGVNDSALESFIEADVNNIVQLFGVFNAATHGPAGKHEFKKLQAIKKRVEDGIMFLAAVAA